MFKVKDISRGKSEQPIVLPGRRSFSSGELMKTATHGGLTVT